MKITRVEAFAGSEGPIKHMDDGEEGLDGFESHEVALTGDLGGGLGISFSNGMKLEVGADYDGGPIEVKLLDADGQQVEGGSQSWSPIYHFEVPQA